MGIPHIRVEHRGTLLSGAEAWSMGHALFPPVGGGIADVQDIADTGVTRFQADVWDATGISSKIRPNSTYVGCRVRQVDASGVTRAVAESNLATPAPGTADSGAQSLPPQCSIVISLLTAQPGARGRGRSYFPGMSTYVLTDSGRLTTVVRDALAAAWKDYFDSLNAALSPLIAGVASDVGGYVNAISGIRVGDVIDTQRRRRDELPEAYKIETLA